MGALGSGASGSTWVLEPITTVAIAAQIFIMPPLLNRQG